MNVSEKRLKAAGADGVIRVRFAASRIFKSQDGKLLLAYLKKRYYDNRLKPEELERQVGRRDVVLDLITMIEETNNVQAQAQAPE